MCGGLTVRRGEAMLFSCRIPKDGWVIDQDEATIAVGSYAAGSLVVIA